MQDIIYGIMNVYGKVTENIGKSIKMLAKIIFIINIVCAILSLLAGIVFAIFYAFDNGIEEELFISLGFGLGGCILFLLNMVSVMLIYGFGELIESNKTK